LAILRISIFIVAASGLLYELLIATVASYLLGNYVMQFSLVVGLFLFSTGIGSYASRYVGENLLTAFIAVELALAFVGGFSSLALIWAYVLIPWFIPCMVAVVFLCGAAVGLELPLMVRLLRRQNGLRASVSDAMALDYIGALLACLLFPLVLLPQLGIARTAIAAGMVNSAAAMLLLWQSPVAVSRKRALWICAATVTVLLGLGFMEGSELTDRAEDRLYGDQIIHRQSSPYQRIVVTRWGDIVSLYLDRQLQFSSIEEAIYHEALVHPAMSLARNPARILVLGGGDGLALREVLKYPSVARVDLVDIDPAMTDLFRAHPMLKTLNGGALDSPKVTIHHMDAMSFLERTDATWDVILADFPDPFHESLAKLFSRGFYLLAGTRVSADGVFATSVLPPPVFLESYSCVLNTITNALGEGARTPLYVVPYHRRVFAFGRVAFILASRSHFRPEDLRVAVPTRTSVGDSLAQWFEAANGVPPVKTEINRMDRPILSGLTYREKRASTTYGR